MLQTIKSMFRPLHTIPSIQTMHCYPLKNHSFSNFDISFQNVHKVLTKKGHIVTTNDSACFVMDKYETKDNEPNILTMAVCTKPNYDSKISFNDNNKSINIELNKNTFEQKQDDGPVMICKEEVKMVDTTKYTCFYTNEK